MSWHNGHSIRKFVVIIFACPSCLRQRRNARAFCLGVRGFTNPPISKALSFDALGNERRAFIIASLAGVPFEIPLREVARQMGFTDRMMCAENRALHKAEAAFGGVDMNEAA